MLIGNILQCYCLKSPLPTLSVILEEIIFTSMFGYIIEGILFVLFVLFFLLFFCTLQLLSAAFDIHMSFGRSPPIEVRNVFSDISKSFDKV